MTSESKQQESALHLAAGLVQVPEECFPEFALVLVSYVGVDGEQLYGYRTLGEGSFSNIMGLLSIVSQSVFHLEEYGEDEEEEEEEGV